MKQSNQEIIDFEKRYSAQTYDPLPVVLVKGEGVKVWDIEGHSYLDLMSAYSATSLGHAHPRILKVLNQQASQLSLVSRAFYTPQLGPFLQRACELTGMDRACPMNTGAEAVETALKAVRKWGYKVKGIAKDQAEIIVCHNNFHGRTITIISASSDAQYRHGYSPFTPGFITIPYNDSAALERAITPNTCAFLVEPMQGEAGMILPSPGYLKACEQICKKHNVLLVCDEVQTGLGRTGAMLASQHENVKPDAVILGKSLGGGVVPVSLFLSRKEIMDVFTPGDHGSTFGGNPLACAVGLEALNVLVEERLSEKALQLGEVFLKGLRAIQVPFIKEVRGKGLFIGIELHAGPVTARYLAEKCMRAGLLCKDTHGTVLRLAPPLVITREQIDLALVAIERVLKDAISLTMIQENQS